MVVDTLVQIRDESIWFPIEMVVNSGADKVYVMLISPIKPVIGLICISVTPIGYLLLGKRPRLFLAVQPGIFYYN